MAGMYALFEEAGKFQTGRILSEAESSAQIELESGKRVKVKAAHVLIKFDKPSPADLMRDAQALSASIELELAWEFAPEDEFGFAEFAYEYFSPQATLNEQTAALFRLFESPHYFRRAGKGRFKKASADVIAQALAGIEKKKQIQAQIEAWATELGQGTCPAPIQTQLYKILFKPDKNAPNTKRLSKPHAPLKQPHWPCSKKLAPSTRLTNSIGSAFCLIPFPNARAFLNCKRPRLLINCHWPTCRPTP
jgi:exoribonuclease-2